VGIAHVKSNAVSDWTGTVTGFNSQGSTATIAATDLVRPSDWNSAHNMLFTLAGNTSGNSTASGSNVVFAGGSNVTLQGSSDTISIHGAAPVETKPVFRVIYDLYSAPGTAHGNSLVSVHPFILPYPLQCSNIKYFGSFNVGTAGNNSSAYMNLSVSGVLYTRNGSTLSSLASWSNTMRQTWSSNATGTVTGVIAITATFNTLTLLQNEYWMALHVSTNNTASNTLSSTNLNHTLTMIPGMSLNSAVQLVKAWGAQTANSQGAHQGLGIISTGVTMGTIAFSALTCTGTRAVMAPFAFELRQSTYQL
jgi:hypothetical protein